LASGDAYAQYKLGAQRTPPARLAAIPVAPVPYSGEELPPKVDLSDRMPPPGDQGQQLSCVAWSVAYAIKSYQEKNENGWDLTNGGEVIADHVFSPAYIYNQINRGEDKGSIAPDALNVVAQQGVPTMADMPYTDQDYRTQPSEAQKAAAAPYKIATWRQVDVKDVDAVKAQLASGFPVMILIPVDKTFMDAKPGDIWHEFVGDDLGGHAIVAVGYDNDKHAFKIINSWSKYWGDDGYGWIDYDFFPQIVWEGYVATDAKNTPVTVVNNDTPPPVNNDTPPPVVADNATFEVTNVQHNVANQQIGANGMLISGTLDVPAGVQGDLQIVIKFYKSGPDGKIGPVVKSYIPAFSTPVGEAATGTITLPLNGWPIQTTWSAFFPYVALVVPGGRTDLAAVPTLFVNHLGVKDGKPILFWVNM
jgi:hypothetical protein